MKGRLLLNVVVGKGATILKLLSCENQALLVGRNALLVLDLGLDVVDGIAGLDLKSDGLAGNCREMGVLEVAPSVIPVARDRILTGLHEDLHGDDVGDMRL